MKMVKQLQPTQLDRYDRQKIGSSSPKMRHNQLGILHQSSSEYLGGVLKSMLTLNEAIIDVKEG